MLLVQFDLWALLIAFAQLPEHGRINGELCFMIKTFISHTHTLKGTNVKPLSVCCLQKFVLLKFLIFQKWLTRTLSQQWVPPNPPDLKMDHCTDSCTVCAVNISALSESRLPGDHQLPWVRKPSLHYALMELSILPSTTVNVWTSHICHEHT